MAATEAQLQQEVDRLRQELSQTEARLTTEREEALANSASYTKALQEKEQAVGDRERIEAISLQRTEERDSFVKNVRSLESQLNILRKQQEEEKRRYDEDKYEHEEKIYSLEAQVRDFESKRRRHEIEVEAKVKDREYEIQRLENRARELQSDIEIRDRDISRLEAERDGLDGQLGDKERQLNMTQDFAELVRGQLAAKQEELSALEQTNSEAQMNKDANAQLTQERAQLEHEMELVNSRMEDLGERLDNASSELEDYKSQLQDLQTENSGLKVRNEELDLRVDRAEDQLRNAVAAQVAAMSNGPRSPRGKGLLSLPPPPLLDVRPAPATRTSTLEDELNMEEDEDEGDYEMFMCDKTDGAITLASIEPQPLSLHPPLPPPKLSPSEIETTISSTPRPAPFPTLSRSRLNPLVSTPPQPAIRAPLTPRPATTTSTTSPLPLSLTHPVPNGKPLAPPQILLQPSLSPLLTLPSLSDPLHLHILRLLLLLTLSTTYYTLQQTLLFIAYNSSSQASPLTQSLYAAHGYMSLVPGLEIIRALFSWVVWLMGGTGGYGGPGSGGASGFGYGYDGVGEMVRGMIGEVVGG